LELLFETVQTIATEAFNPMPHQQGQVLNNRKRTENRNANRRQITCKEVPFSY
jgi:hypothetical protein